MDDLVALVVGIAKYKELDGWSIPEDRTAQDAITVTQSLRKRGLPAKKIKLLLSMGANGPNEVMGVPVHFAEQHKLSEFITGELGRPPFDGTSFFLFCSGHGFRHKSEPCLITADSRPAVVGQTIYRCLGLNKFCDQLRGMPQFAKQVLSINACQVPSNWLGLDTKPFFVETTEPAQYAEIQQVRFLAAPEMQTAPVGNGPNGLSNGFAAAVCACIDKYDLPPNASDWEGALRATWENLDTLGLYGADKSKFKLLRDHICKINRDRQCGLAKKALELAYDWGTKSVGQAVPDLSRDTLIDLHAHHSDQLALLMTRLGIEVFNGKLVSGPIHIVAWPDRGLTQSERKRSLIRSLAESLVDDDSLGTADRIVDAMAAMGRCVRVAFIEIKGPCSDDDRALIDDMKLFWQAIIARAVALGTRVASARLLIVGHVNPDPGAGGVIDSASYYHNPVPPLQDKRRLGEVHPQQLRSWLDDVIPHERFPGRGDIDAVIARALGGQLIDLLEPMRMARIVEAVVQRAG